MEQIPNKVFKATVVKAETVAQGVKKLTFKIGEPFSFFAWQYVWVEIPELKVPDPRGSRRAFSIFNTINADNTIEIVARISESGYKQSLFGLDVGEKVVIHGPFGNSFIVDDEHQPEYIVMIAGGVGIAAFLPMLWTIRDKKYRSKCFLVYLNKDKETTPFLPELDALKKEMPSFTYLNKYEYFSWTDVAEFVAKAKGSIEWWVAGPQAMVNRAYDELEKGGVSRTDMVFENFYPTRQANLTFEEVNKQLHENNLFARNGEKAERGCVGKDGKNHYSHQFDGLSKGRTGFGVRNFYLSHQSRYRY